MACLHPITIATEWGPIQTQCKQCLNCRIAKQSALTAMCLLEDATASTGWFLTLTYREAPEKGEYRDMSLFLKRLRRHESYHYGNQTIRYLSVGEYGHKHGRFHFHSLIWNMNPNTVDSLTELWPHGFVKAGTVTPASVRYTARYTLKFETKGEESCHGWSKNPLLGTSGTRLIAARMRDDPKKRYDVPQPPSVISLQGKSYPLARTLRREFMREFLQDEKYDLPTNTLKHAAEYKLECIAGDPTRKEARRQHARNTFLETARFSYGEF